jgi:hypothetical protein
MTPVEKVLAKLPGAKKSGKRYLARCPAHDDRKASLSISEGDDGRALLNCFAGCGPPAILAALGLTWADLFPVEKGPATNRNGKPRPRARTFPTANDAVAELERRHGKRSALWTYYDARGEPVGVVVRWDRSNGKEIRPVSRRGDGWRIEAMPIPRPLYGLPELAKARRVVVVEGEKVADQARRIGFTATTSAGGSQVAGKTDWRPLVGKDVWILPDNDPPGEKYAGDVARLAHAAGAQSVRIVRLAEHAPQLPDGGDLANVLTDPGWCGLPLGDAGKPADLVPLIERLAQEAEPWRPDDADDLNFRPFPVDALPQPIRGFVDAGARAIGCDPSYLALPLLTVIASAIGNTRRLELKRGWSAPAIIWGAIVGESGTAKTPAFKLVMRPVRERQRKALERHEQAAKQYEMDLARWEKEMAAWKRDKKVSGDPPKKPDPPQAERFIVSDTTVEALAPILLANPRGVLLARDELAGWIGSFDRYAGKGKAGADAANWLSMHNAESVIVDRKTGIPRTIHVPQAVVCVSGGIQPVILHRALGSEHRESGLAARLLLTCPPRRVKRWTEEDIDPGAEAELARLLDRLYELQPSICDDGEARPVLVRLTSEAKAAWTAYYNDHAQEQVDLSGDLSAAWSKLEEYAARLALLIHFTRWAVKDLTLAHADRVDGDSMAAGIRLTNWFKHEARRVYAMLDETDTARDQRRLVEWIGRKGGTVTAREVQQGCRWLKEPGAAEAALEELIKAGRGIWQDVPTTPKGGRPARVFVLSTASTVYETPTNPEENGGSVEVDSVDAPENDSPASEGPASMFGGTPQSGPYRERF